jgi:membrane protein required for colicin V production
MEWLDMITAFDVLVLLIFLAFLVRGIWIGFIRQISSLFAMIGGFLLAGYFDNAFYQLILPFFSNSNTAFLLTYIVLFGAFFFLLKVLGLGLKKVIDVTLTTWFDRTVGGLFGFIKAVFVSSLILIIISSYLSGSNKYLKNSFTYPFLARTSKVILLLIRDYDLRSYFVPKKPAIELPSLDKWSSREEKAGNIREPEAEHESAVDEPKARQVPL